MSKSLAERVRRAATRTDHLFIENNACDMQAHRDELLAIATELERIAEEMRTPQFAPPPASGPFGHIQVIPKLGEWADRLAARKEP